MGMVVHDTQEHKVNKSTHEWSTKVHDPCLAKEKVWKLRGMTRMTHVQALSGAHNRNLNKMYWEKTRRKTNCRGKGLSTLAPALVRSCSPAPN
ncbi:hypothetical protein Hdeb2414_s0004g00141751 [Helianthus debilis subsp. tardiflorus]